MWMVSPFGIGRAVRRAQCLVHTSQVSTRQRAFRTALLSTLWHYYTEGGDQGFPARPPASVIRRFLLVRTLRHLSPRLSQKYLSSNSLSATIHKLASNLCTPCGKAVVLVAWGGLGVLFVLQVLAIQIKSQHNAPESASLTPTTTLLQRARLF